MFPERELATLLAALRFWQRHGPSRPNSLFNHLEIEEQHLLDEIGSSGHVFEPLTTEEIDILCERLNVCEATVAEPCECERPGYFHSGVPGILARIENGRLAPAAKVERCDLCQRFASDDAARRELVRLGLV